MNQQIKFFQVRGHLVPFLELFDVEHGPHLRDGEVPHLGRLWANTPWPCYYIPSPERGLSVA